MRSERIVAYGIGLEIEHRGYDLQAVFHPVAYFLEQHLLPIERCLELKLVPLAFDGHAQEVGRALQEGDIVLAELPFRSAVDLEHAVGRSVALEDDIHGAANAMLHEQLRRPKPLLVLEMIADDRLPGTQRKPGRGFKISAD